jgi:hypothetical protein
MRCDEGYHCDVCQLDVEAIVDSDLYLRYILGEIPMEQLHLHPERHIRCNPSVAQYIVHPDFSEVICEGMFSKSNFDREYVLEQEARVTRAWKRLQEIPSLGLTLIEYPLSITPIDE